MKKETFQKIKPEIVALIVLVPLVMVLGLTLLRPKGAPTTTPASSIVTTPSPQVASPGPLAILPTETPRGRTTVTEPAPVPVSSPAPAGETVTLTITSPKKTSELKVPVTKSASVLDALKAAAQQGVEFETKDYGAPLGIFVQSLAGIDNDNARQIYWTLYINGKMSETGASSTIVRAGDHITWKYEHLPTGN